MNMPASIKHRKPKGETGFLLENTVAPTLKHVTKIHYECPAIKATS